MECKHVALRMVTNFLFLHFNFNLSLSFSLRIAIYISIEGLLLTDCNCLKKEAIKHFVNSAIKHFVNSPPPQLYLIFYVI